MAKPKTKKKKSAQNGYLNTAARKVASGVGDAAQTVARSVATQTASSTRTAPAARYDLLRTGDDILVNEKGQDPRSNRAAKVHTQSVDSHAITDMPTDYHDAIRQGWKTGRELGVPVRNIDGAPDFVFRDLDMVNTYHRMLGIHKGDQAAAYRATRELEGRVDKQAAKSSGLTFHTKHGVLNEQQARAYFRNNPEVLAQIDKAVSEPEEQRSNHMTLSEDQVGDIGGGTVTGAISTDAYLNKTEQQRALEKANETGKPQVWYDERNVRHVQYSNTPEAVQAREEQKAIKRAQKEERYLQEQEARRSRTRRDYEPQTAQRQQQLIDESESVGGQIEELESVKNPTDAQVTRLNQLRTDQAELTARLGTYGITIKDGTPVGGVAGEPATYADRHARSRTDAITGVQEGTVDAGQAIATWSIEDYLTPAQMEDPAVVKQVEQWRKEAMIALDDAAARSPMVQEQIVRDFYKKVGRMVKGDPIAPSTDDLVMEYDFGNELTPEQQQAVDRVRHRVETGSLSADEGLAQLQSWDTDWTEARMESSPKSNEVQSMAASILKPLSDGQEIKDSAVFAAWYTYEDTVKTLYPDISESELMRGFALGLTKVAPEKIPTWVQLAKNNGKRDSFMSRTPVYPQWLSDAMEPSSGFKTINMAATSPVPYIRENAVESELKPMTEDQATDLYLELHEKLGAEPSVDQFNQAAKQRGFNPEIVEAK